MKGRGQRVRNNGRARDAGSDSRCGRVRVGAGYRGVAGSGRNLRQKFIIMSLINSAARNPRPSGLLAPTRTIYLINS